MSKRKLVKATSINNIIVVSDTHGGCRFGLWPNYIDTVLDGGVKYVPSKLQRIVANWWDEFWGSWVPMVTRGEDYAVVVNGDSQDGKHHNSTTQISQNLSDQQDIVADTYRPIVDKASHFFMVRGTPAHVGESAENEERIAEALGAIPDEDGHYCRNELWLKVGGGLVNFMHHIGTAGSAAYESSALMREYSESCVEAGRWGITPPDIVVRSHRHRHLEIRAPSRNGYGIIFTTAGWQLKTPFTWKIAGARLTLPQIGGSLIRWGDEELYTRHKTWNIERSNPEVLEI